MCTRNQRVYWILPAKIVKNMQCRYIKDEKMIKSEHFSLNNLVFHSICTTFSLCEKVLSFGNKNKNNVFLFCIVLTYLYLCTRI